jgi:hypothetical protein
VIRLTRWWFALVIVAALAVPGVAPAQPGSPIVASIFFTNPPANLTYGVGAPVGIGVLVRNASGVPLNTTAGFQETPFWRQLFFTDAAGGLVTNTDQPHFHDTILSCYSRDGVLEPFTAIPVLPLEVVPAAYATQFNLADARQFYNLRPGRQTVNARFSFVKYDNVDPRTFIVNCDQFAGQTVLNVSSGAVGRQDFEVVSNTLTFCIGYCTFSGFLTPLQGDSACAQPPCRTFKFGSTVPVKFQLLDGSGTPMPGATARLAAVQLKGAPPTAEPIDLGTGAADTGNLFRYDAAGKHYMFNLDTGVLARGVWRLDVKLDSGAVQSVQIGLR